MTRPLGRSHVAMRAERAKRTRRNLDTLGAAATRPRRGGPEIGLMMMTTRGVNLF
jgi:hypothetical protein